MAPLSRLNGHPDRNKVPGVETNTGPLGHGLPVGVGAAIGAQIDGASWRTFVLTGDGELQEGSNWEAAMSAGHHDLDNLTVIVDRNRLQQGDCDREHDAARPAGGQVARLRLGGDGGRRPRPRRAARGARRGAPRAGASRRCVIAHTHKGKGVSFMENRAEWHHKVPSARAARAARSRSWAMSDAKTDATALRRSCMIAATRSADVLLELGEEDERIVVVNNDSVGSSNTGPFRKRFPHRLVNVGIAEQNMVGVGAGLANGGKIPSSAPRRRFLTGRALEQIKADVAYSNANVKLVGISSGMAYGELGPTHHSIEDLAWMRAIANLTVVVPADPERDAAGGARRRAHARTDLPPHQPHAACPPSTTARTASRSARRPAARRRGRHPHRQRRDGDARARRGGSARGAGRRRRAC